VSRRIPPSWRCSCAAGAPATSRARPSRSTAVRRQGCSEMGPARIAVIGAGLIGRKHLGILKDDPAFEVAGIADPSPQAETYAREHGFQYFTGTEALLDTAKLDGVIIANPNAMHRATALPCLARGLPAILEKPIA